MPAKGVRWFHAASRSRAPIPAEELLEDDAVGSLVHRLLPLATVVTPNLLEAQALTGFDAPPEELAEALVGLGAAAALVTGGHADAPADHLFDGREHHEIPFERT